MSLPEAIQEQFRVFTPSTAQEGAVRELLLNGEEPRIVLQGIVEVAMCQEGIESAEILITKEHNAEEFELIASMGETKKGRMLVFDLIGEGTPCGVLNITLNEGTYDVDDKLFFTLAHHASITVERLKSSEKMQHFVDRLQVLNELNQLIATSVSIDRVIKSIARESAFRFAADSTLVFILEQKSGILLCEGAYGTDPQEVAPFTESDNGVFGQTLRTGGLITIPRVTPQMIQQLPFIKQLGLETLHLSCLEVRGESLGILVCGFQTEIAINEHDRTRVEEFSQAAAVAIANARTQERIRTYSERLEELVQNRTAQLEVQTKKAEEANHAKSQFLANMSHELRTPLTAIVGYSSVLIEGIFGELNDKQSDALGAVVRSSDHLKNLIDDVLNLARIESGKEAPEPKAVPVQELLQQSYKLINQNAVNKQITLEPLEIPEKLQKANLWFDQKHMQQIMINLLSNAVKYTPSGGKVWITVETVSDKLLICVYDSGVGIPPEKIETLFERFERGEDTYSKSQEGTGIGLNLTKRLVELNGGSIGAKSKVGEGSMFWVMAPLAGGDSSHTAETPSVTAANLERLNAAKAVRLDGLTAVVVDDSKATREVVETILRAAGATVSLADSVQNGLTLIDSVIPDVIITDLAMPGESGLVLIEAIRKRTGAAASKTPIIVMSACAFPQDRQLALDTGASSFLAKPFKPYEIVAEVRRVTLANALKGSI